MKPQGEIILYQPNNDSIKLEVRLEDVKPSG